MNQTDVLPNTAAGQLNPNDWNGGDAADSAAPQTEFISFAIGDDQYGVDIMAVREIKGWSNVTHLAETARIRARRAQPARRHRSDR